MRWLPNILTAYMIAAFAWWAVHLWRENDRLLAADTALVTLAHRAQPQLNTPSLSHLQQRHAARQRMIVAEGLFFCGCLIAGLWLIRRSARREIAVARQRRNFLLSVTHELKSPLAGIRLVLDTLQKRDLNKEQTKPLLINSLRDTQRLQSLVEDMLLAARFEEDWRPVRETLALQPLVRDCIDGLCLRFPECDIQSQMPDTDLNIIADRTGMISLIQNLLENAVKYSNGAGPVTIAATKRPDGKTEISVADFGPGIPDAEKKAVFDQFYRIGNEETRKSTGTGLGLYIVNQVVQLHGGQISIGDNQPHGAVFKVVI